MKVIKLPQTQTDNLVGGKFLKHEKKPQIKQNIKQEYIKIKQPLIE
jgi:hypothetical protein